MRPEHIRYLVEPGSKLPLELRNATLVDGRVREGSLVEPTSGKEFPIIGFIPRFVDKENYADNFGLQWNIHFNTQHDRQSGHAISGDRFRLETKWPGDLQGELILEAGCGSGRFTPHALSTGATVVSFDYSNAVEASYKSNGMHPALLLVQADIYHMPFRDHSFERVFCFGVLQHTPDVKRSFMELVKKLRKGGAIASDVYLKNFSRYFLGPKYKVRPFVRHMKPEQLYMKVKSYVDFMWPLSRWLRRIPKLGRLLNWALLIPDYSNLLTEAEDEELREWAYLDAFDMLSPRYDNPQTVSTFRQWHEEAGLEKIEVHRGYNGVEGRGVLLLA